MAIFKPEQRRRKSIPKIQYGWGFSRLLSAYNYPSQKTAIKQHPESRTGCICYEVIDPRVPGRQPGLQHFNGKARQKSQQDDNQGSLCRPTHSREIGKKREAERNKADDIDAHVFPVSRCGVKMAPWYGEKLGVQDQVSGWDEQIILRTELLMNNSAFALSEQVESDRSLLLSHYWPVGIFPVVVMRSHFLRQQLAPVDCDPVNLPRPGAADVQEIAEHQPFRKNRYRVP